MVLRKMLHILMAAVVVVSTLGFTINMHFCHDQLIDLALNTPARSCCDSGMGNSCPSEEGIQAMDHCEDDSIRLEAQDDFMGTSLVVRFESNSYSKTLFSATLQNDHSLMEESLKTNYPSNEHSPPYQEVDLATIQSYLI